MFDYLMIIPCYPQILYSNPWIVLSSVKSYAIEKHTKYRTGGGLEPGRFKRKLRGGAGVKGLLKYGWDRIYPMISHGKWWFKNFKRNMSGDIWGYTVM